MNIEETALSGVLILTPRRFGDERGFFSENWSQRTMAAHGLHFDFVQDNHSLSPAAGTLRGLHFQAPPHAQDKLVRCGRGRLLDVAVDVRANSPTYGKHVKVELSAENGRQLLIPKGFAHGFLTLEVDTEICYKCSAFYEPTAEVAVRWDDPELAIDWGLGSTDPILNCRDANAPTLAELPTFSDARVAGKQP